MKVKEGMTRIKSNRWIEVMIIFLSTFLLYVNTLGHKYCLDDAVVITRNEFTQKGFAGITDIFSTESFTGFFGKQKELVSGSRYRPLSIVSFAVEQEFFDGNPMISHFINILLYALTGLFIYLLLKKLVQNTKPPFTYLPLLTTLLFIFHPVHTEVVANIKGRDEIMALLFSLAACYTMLRYLENKKLTFLVVGAFLWLLGLFSKENAIVFWILMPMMFYISGIKEKKSYFLPMIAFSMSAILFLSIRHMVIGGGGVVSNELMNNSFIGANLQQKYATIFFTLWQYIQLLFFPLQLTYDYYPYHVSLVTWNNIFALLGVISYLLLGIWMLISIRKNSLVTFALAFYLLPLLPVSNLFFPIGTFMSERFIYFSSLGFSLLIIMGFTRIINDKPALKITVFVLLGGILLLFSSKTISRNKAWYDDYSLFTTDVKTSFNSAKSNCSAGGVLLESTDTIQDVNRKNRVINQSISYLNRAVVIHPTYFDALLLLGNAYFKKEIATDSSVLCYSAILNIDANYNLAFTNMQALVNREKNIDVKIKLLTKMLGYRPNDYQVCYQLGKLYGKEKNDLEKSISYLTKAMLINPKGKDAYVDLGVAYGLKQNFAHSAEMLQKAAEIDPNDANIFINLGITWQNLGETDKAKECFKKAERLKK